MPTARVEDLRRVPLRRPLLRKIATAAAILILVYAAFLVAANPRFEWGVVARYFTTATILEGLATTLVLTAIVMVLASVLGAVVATARLSGVVLLSSLAWLFTYVFRAVPALVQLIFWFNLAYLVPRITIGMPFGPTLVDLDTNKVITTWTAAILGLGLCEAAYMAEIVRAGLLSVDRGQREAAMAIGLRKGQTFFRIVLPQSMRFIIPPLGSQTIAALKGTSLVSVIAMTDLLHSAQTIYNRTLQVVPLLLVATLWYLILVSVLSLGQAWLERRFSRGHRPLAGEMTAEPT
jgi:polar amino acid transport system permease protein